MMAPMAGTDRFVGVLLLIGWVRLFAYWGRLPVENISAISWFGLFSVTAILAVSMSWPRVRGGGGHTPS